MKYRFSEIFRFGDWSWERPYKGKYGCQVFDYETHAYIDCIICDTLEEVYAKIKELKSEVKNEI